MADDTLQIPGMHDPPDPPNSSKPKHTDGGPTRGAVIMIIIVALIFGALAILQGFANGHTNAKLRRDEACQARLQQDNLARNAALASIQADDREAVSAWIHRVSLDVRIGNVADIPRAYEAYRLAVQANDRARARYGALIVDGVVPPGCKLSLAPSAATTLPTIATQTSSPRRTSLPPLPTTTTFMFQRATVVVTVAGPTTTFTAFEPGPTRTVHVVVTTTLTHTMTARVRVTVTATVTHTRPPTPLKTK